MSFRNKSVISIQNLSVRLNDRIVFSDLHWTVKENEFWAVLGENGSGKSLLVNALCGEVPFLGGEPVYTLKKKFQPELYDNPQSFVSYISFNQNREMKTDESLFVQARYWSSDETVTVWDYLSYENVMEINPFEIVETTNFKILYGKYRKRVCSLFKIDHLIQKEVSKLSHGECRRVMMVRAILKNPGVLILDNPFLGLDTKYREYFNCVIIPFLIKQKIVLIVAGTDLNDIPSAVSHILYIKDFKVIFAGRKEDCKKVSESHLFKVTKLPIPLFLNKNKKQLNVPCISMSHVNITAENNSILKDISWTVWQGEHWAVFGPNGSGKTTLLSLILGDHPQIYANEIGVFGKRWGVGTAVSDIKKKIGWVSPELQICYPSQTTCINTVLSGFHDSIGLYHRTTTMQRASAKMIIKFFDMTDIEEYSFGSVSEGKQRLLLLMRALVKKPDLLILDEPLQGLSRQYRNKILLILDQLCQNSSITLIYVTHNIDELPSGIKKRCFLENGRIVKIGEVE